MKIKLRKMTIGVIISTFIVTQPVYGININESNKKIDINIEKTSVILEDKSKISIKFNENLNSNNITINYVCYDETLSTILNYNSQSSSYEGVMKFDIDPEYLNVWKIESIVINNDENPQTLYKQELENLGLNLNDYNITQEYILSNTQQSIETYIKKTSSPIKVLAGTTIYDNAVSISKEGWTSKTDKLIIVNGDIIADGITATPLATTYDAPILIVKKDSIPEVIKEEIDRLNPNEIVIVGGEGTVSKSVENELKTINSCTISRIWGDDRHETSLRVAQEIDKHHDVSKVFIANGFQGDVDALTIAAKAGEDKQPIILTEKYNVPNETYKWLESEELKDTYFIGGPGTLDTEVIHQMDNIISNPASGSVYNNRIYGYDRHETNAKVMEKFYPNNELNAVLVARSDELADALVAGPLAAKLKSPILITQTNKLSEYHTSNLDKKSTELVYKIGNTISNDVMNEIAYKLSPHNAGAKTVVIDPGHGGADPGAINNINKNIKEKDYTLDTSLAATSYLRANNINVVLTRETDLPSNKKLSLSERTSMANSINPDLLVSVHFNSYNTKAKGVEVFYRNADKNGGTSKTLASNILNSILEKFKFTNRGIKTKIGDSGKDYYHMIRESKAPSVIVECSFIDNKDDQLLVNTIEKRNNLGIQIGKGIQQTLK